jgi:hypothetical protein
MSPAVGFAAPSTTKIRAQHLSGSGNGGRVSRIHRRTGTRHAIHPAGHKDRIDGILSNPIYVRGVCLIDTGGSSDWVVRNRSHTTSSVYVVSRRPGECLLVGIGLAAGIDPRGPRPVSRPGRLVLILLWLVCSRSVHHALMVPA